MVDFILSNNNDVDVKLRTDANSVDDLRFTILQVIDQTTDFEKSVVNLSFRQGLAITKQELITLATDNNLALIAQVKGGTTVDPDDIVVLAHTLGTPGSFAATVNSATQITLNWTAVTGADGYILQRATNAGFTTGLTTLLDGSPASKVLLKVDTGLTTATQYWYRIKAVGLNQADSAYATDNDTTQ